MNNHYLKRVLKSAVSVTVAMTVFLSSTVLMVNQCGAAQAITEEVGKVDVEKAVNDVKATSKNNSSITVKTVKKKKLTITYIDVGQGDSTFIELPNKKTMLIDAGEDHEVSAVIDLIKGKNYKKIDYLIGTHPHADHIGGVEEVVRTFKIGKIFMPDEKATSQTYKNMMAAIKEKGLTVKEAFAGMKILNKKKLGLKATVLAPEESESSSNANNHSIVFKLKYKKNKFLFTGDAESLSEGEMVDAGYDLSADVLKVGHHGSTTSTSATFLAEVNPKAAVISVGEGNSYGHPGKDTVKRLQTYGAKVLRTDKSGNITVVSNGKKITYSTAKKKKSMTLNAQTGSAVKTKATDNLQLAFSHKGGWYKNEFALTLATNNSKAKIYYTLDGSEPDYDTNYSTQQYSDVEKISVYDVSKDLNYFSAENLTWYRAHQYTPAQGLQPKCMTVKAYAVYDGQRTPTITENYFVDPELNNKYGVKVISLTGNTDDFFRNGEENAGLMREEWRRATDSALGHVQIFDENGKEIVNQNVNVKLHGSYSKMFNQKSFRLHADANYDAFNNKFAYPLFDGLTDINGEPITEYKRIIARNGGNDCTGTMLRDAFNSRLIGELGVGVMASEPAVIYHCGEFYGVCNIRERFDDHYISDHYNIEREDVVIVTATDAFELNEGVVGVDDQEWKDLVAFVNGNDMTDADNYAEFEKKVDVDNYIKYITSELYIANTDWVVNNVRVWKSKGVATSASKDTTDDNGVNYNDGRWRFLAYDTDLSDGVFHPDGNYGDNPTNSNFDSLEYMRQFSLTGTEIDLFKLLENENFRQRFVDIYTNNINTTFKSNKVNALLDEMAAPIEKAMPYEISRFGYLADMNAWKANLQGIKDFFAPRGDAVLKQLGERWSLGENKTLTVEGIGENASDYVVSGNKLVKGSVDGDKWTGKYFASNTIELQCKPTDGRTFSGWEITDANGTRQVTDEKLVLSISDDTTVRALLTGEITITPTPEVSSEPSATPTPGVTSEPSVESNICKVKYNGKVKSIIKGGYFMQPKDPTKAGQKFVGWYLDKKFKTAAVFPLKVDGDITLYAKFKTVVPAVKAKSIKVVSSVVGGKKVYKVSWKAVKKSVKNVTYRVEVSNAKKKRFKAATAYKKATKATITQKMLKKAKVNVKKKLYFRVVSRKKLSGEWYTTASGAKKG